LQRWPDGIDGEAWYQQHPPEGTPTYVRRFARDDRSHLVIDDLDGLRWAANLAALTLHVWSSHVGDRARSDAEIARDLALPDWLVIDLDPGEGAFAHAVEVALAVRHLLDALGLPSFPKTTGKRGLHIVVPVARGTTHAEVQRLAEHLAVAVAKVLPHLATVERSIGKRGGRLYVDYVQNGEGRTIAAPYTLRAIDGAPVSAPLRWSEVGPRLDPNAFTLRNMRARIDAGGDLFAPVLGGGPDIRALLARLG
jgi:bifunctional non-homologous end joining protein LigD